MDSRYSFEDDAPEEQRIVYVRPISVDDLPDEVKREMPGIETLYAVHDTDGERLALVTDRKLAFVLARQHDLAPVNVH